MRILTTEPAGRPALGAKPTRCALLAARQAMQTKEVRRIALLSDVHANLEALEAVLRDVDAHQPDVVVVLGDVINYGPNPRECLTLIAVHADVLLAGNHEKGGRSPNPTSWKTTRERCWNGRFPSYAVCGPWERLRESVLRDAHAAAQHQLDGLYFVHGSAAKPFQQYIWPGHPQHHLQLNSRSSMTTWREPLASFPRDAFLCRTHPCAGGLDELWQPRAVPDAPRLESSAELYRPRSVFTFRRRMRCWAALPASGWS